MKEGGFNKNSSDWPILLSPISKPNSFSSEPLQKKQKTKDKDILYQ